MPNSKKVPLKGSDIAPLQGERPIGPSDPHQLVEISVILRHRQPLSKAISSGKFMSHRELSAQCGADEAHIEMIRKFANDNKLQMLERGDEILRRTVTLAGTVAKMEKAFGIELIDIEYPDGTYRGRVGTIQIPEELGTIVTGVFGLDDRPVAKPHFRFRGNGSFGVRASNTAYTPVEVAKLYEYPQNVNFPQDANGSGQVIGLIELGGGYRPADFQEYFRSLGLQAPKVKACCVNHAKNRPTTAQSADTEVMLDIEMAGAVAPGATLAVYFAPNTSRGFQDALSTAVHDQLLGPRVISISWGGPEANWTEQSMMNFDEVAQEAGLLGITVIASSGDNGSSDGLNDGQNHVDFPASCPHVLATGGTRLLAANGMITSETAWNDGAQGGASGGGYSTVFARPAWQKNTSAKSNRGVPDVAGNADPDTGYKIQVDGQQMVVGGTSAVAPLWAGLIALLNQKLHTRSGFINPSLYSMNESVCFREITSGNNGEYSAKAGWNPVTGLGSPKAIQIIQAEQETAMQSIANKESRSHSSVTH
jgi:kumamolisin